MLRRFHFGVHWIVFGSFRHPFCSHLVDIGFRSAQVRSLWIPFQISLASIQPPSLNSIDINTAKAGFWIPWICWLHFGFADRSPHHRQKTINTSNISPTHRQNMPSTTHHRIVANTYTSQTRYQHYPQYPSNTLSEQNQHIV